MKARIAKILRHPDAQRAAAIMFSDVMERGRNNVVNPARAAKRRLRAMDHRSRGRVHAKLRKLGERIYPRSVDPIDFFIFDVVDGNGGLVHKGTGK